MLRPSPIRVLFALLCFLISGCLSSASEPRFISDRAFYEDPTGIATYDQVTATNFVSYQGTLNAGYRPGVMWVRLKIAESPDKLILVVKPPYIDDIDLFDEGRKLYSVMDGGYVPPTPAALNSLPYAFELPPAQGERTVYLRFKSAHSYHITIEALPASEFYAKDAQEQAIYAAFIACAFLLTILLFNSWLMDKNRVVAIFTFQQLVALLHAIFISGFGQLYLNQALTASVVNFLCFMVLLVYPIVAFFANRMLLTEFGISKIYRFGLNSLIAGSLLVAALFVVGDPMFLKWNATLILFAMGYFWVVAIFGIRFANIQNESEKFIVTVLKLYYSFNLALWILAILPLLGHWNVGTLAFQSLFVYNLLSGLMLFFVLQQRFKYRFQAEVTRISALETQAISERKQREELSMMMAMLSHELKTPLSVLKLILDEKVAGSDVEVHAARAISNMTFVVNRCLQLGKLEAEKIEVHPSVMNVEAAIRDTSHKFGPDAMRRLVIEGDSRVSIVTDLDIFGIVMANLVDNALKYSARESTVHISFDWLKRGEKNGLSISVTNSVGPMGVPDPSQVFKKYYRNEAATKTTGSGLGLFLISQLVNILHGEVQYDASHAQVTFRLWLPN